MRVKTVERNWIWVLATASVFLVAMVLTTCAKAATHHRYHHHRYHHHHYRHHRAAPPVTGRLERTKKGTGRVRVSHSASSKHRHHRYASQTRHHRNRSTGRVVREAALALPSGPMPQLVSAMRTHLGGNPTGWSHNWCAHFLDMELRATGHRGGGNLARGYASYGRPCGAQPGAIAVMPHHVGVVMSVGPGYVTLISGNHGHRVGVGRYPRSRIIAYRMPS